MVFILFMVKYTDLWFIAYERFTLPNSPELFNDETRRIRKILLAFRSKAMI